MCALGREAQPVVQGHRLRLGGLDCWLCGGGRGDMRGYVHVHFSCLFICFGPLHTDAPTNVGNISITLDTPKTKHQQTYTHTRRPPSTTKSRTHAQNEPWKTCPLGKCPRPSPRPGAGPAPARRAPTRWRRWQRRSIISVCVFFWGGRGLLAFVV